MSVRKFFVELKKYFEDNVTFVNGEQLVLTTYGGKNYATLSTTHDVWVNLRLNKTDDSLLEIGLFFNRAKGQQEYYSYYSKKIEIEKILGKLVWQEHCYFDPYKQSGRIGRYGYYAKPPKPTDMYLRGKFTQAIEENPYDFDTDNIKRVAEELIKYYKVKVFVENNLF